MGTLDQIHPGMTLEASFLVEEQHSAPHVGSGSVSVLATPSLIAFMEIVAHKALEQYLSEGKTSVGISIEMRHLAATPVGESVRVACEILEVDGWKITFSTQVWDEHEKVAEGEHQRAIIDIERFMQRVKAKAES
jgi:fluoroacetyl-CoA thioesterase